MRCVVGLQYCERDIRKLGIGLGLNLTLGVKFWYAVCNPQLWWSGEVEAGGHSLRSCPHILFPYVFVGACYEHVRIQNTRIEAVFMIYVYTQDVVM